MKIDVCTLFPEMFSTLEASLMGKAISKNAFSLNVHNIRDYSADKHKKCDDYPFGGGAGMLMMVQPIYDCVTSIKGWETARKIYLSPRGKTLGQKMVEQMAKENHIIMVCGHYEGIDERAIELLNLEEISIGDYVLSGGELPAMVVIDSVARYVPGVLGNVDSTKNESFSDGLLEYPQYTRPAEFMGKKVPEVLLSGNHGAVDKWRESEAKKLTKKRRPDILKKEI